MSYCLYFQSRVKKEKVWFLTSVLRSCEHLVLDRTIDLENSIFEFFVPSDFRDEFISLMEFFEEKKIISDLSEIPNRFK
jgi:hypothetical protein